MAKDKCDLSDEELITACNEWVSKLCNSGGQAWSMQVPVNFNKDPDMLFVELANRFKEACQGNIVKTKYTIGQKLYFIDNDKIISCAVNKIETETYGKRTDVTYSFITKKAQQLIDHDTVVQKSEKDCFATPEELIAEAIKAE